MKMNYEKPEIEFEMFQLDTSIANQCENPIKLGPSEQCEGYSDGPGVGFEDSVVDLLSAGNGGFYENQIGTVCTCYVGSSSNYFSS